MKNQLDRFLNAQENVYSCVLAELKAGRKRSHWMWFVFPQVEGLGFSSTTQFYAIKSFGEASAYLAHPVLGARLVECADILLTLKETSPFAVFGTPDDIKLLSSMTLFAGLAGPDSVFERVLEKFYPGKRDERTVAWLERSRPHDGTTPG